jgi:DnaJ like chaperone protein
MGLLGALVGGSLGYMLGGVLGAMVGGVIGARVGDPSPFDIGNAQSSRRLVGRCPSCRADLSFAPGESLVCPRCGARLHVGPGVDPGRSGTGATDAGTAQSAFLVALISLAAKVAKADGQVSPAEVQAFDAFLRDELSMSADERRVAAQIFNRARDSRVPAAAFARQLRAIMAGNPDRLRDLVTLLLKVAWADGRFDQAEESLIRAIAAELGLSARDYDEARALFSRGNLASAYAMLGLEPSASVAEIKRSYRRLAQEYHPDKLAAKGLPEDFTKFANEKLQAINEAYSQIRKSRDF